MNNDERRLWVLNDEGLYRESRQKGITAFIKEHRTEIDAYIKRRLG